MKSINLMAVLFTLVLPRLLAACGGGPREYSFNIQIRHGKPVDGATTFRVKQGDTVTFNISSDIPGEVHLHGYDLEAEMAPGEKATLSFTANATGRFLIEIEETEVEIGFLEVQPR
jgi:hypothetical protein